MKLSVQIYKSKSGKKISLICYKQVRAHGNEDAGPFAMLHRRASKDRSTVRTTLKHFNTAVP